MPRLLVRGVTPNGRNQSYALTYPVAAKASNPRRRELGRGVITRATPCRRQASNRVDADVRPGCLLQRHTPVAAKALESASTRTYIRRATRDPA